MQLLVSYDVCTETSAGRRRLRKVATICLDFGQRVQKSVFECSVTDMDYEKLKDRLTTCIDPGEDSLRIYRLSTPKEEHVEHFGLKPSIDFEGPLVV